MKVIYLAIVSLYLLITLNNYAQSSLSLTNLRTEYKTNPIGIDVQIPRVSWEILSDKNNTSQTKYEILFAETKENLQKEINLLWEVKENIDQSIHIEYKGPKLQSRQKVFWKVRIWDNHNRVSDWSDIAYWEMGLLSDYDWKANWIAGEFNEDTTKSNPAHYFRKSFKLDNNIKSAKLYITSHGLYEAFINGKRVGNEVFTPGWTSYQKRIQYQTYDVTNLLNENENGIGITIGDGWYRGSLVWEKNRNVYGTKLAVLAQLEIEFENENKSIIKTDESWEVSNKGPIIMSDIYMGEKYDARNESKEWSEYNFEDLNYQKVVKKDYPKNTLIAPEGVPVRKIQEIKPINIIDKKNGTYIYDMGQNMVGWVKLKVKGPAGTIIKLRHAEVLDKNDEFYTDNLRLAKQTTEYILNGKDEEIFEPHFTFQGFRYVEVSGYPGIPNYESIRGIVIHSDMKPTGSFECSDSLVNQLQHNIVWGLKGNFLDVPTDCPQRDERLGWTGDAQVFAPTACFNVDAASFYTKWLKDLSADQRKDGSIPDVVPDAIRKNFAGHTGWADAGVIIPWTVYLNYGDKRILAEQYESMKKWILYMQERAGDDFLWTDDWHYGDWLAFASTSSAYMGAYTETDLIATAYYAYSTTLLGKICDILGKTEDAKIYFQLADNIKTAFTDEFLTKNGRLVSNTQTAYTLSLAFDLLPAKLKIKSAEYLADNVERFKHITTGFLGTPLINKTLTEYGYKELAYLLLNRKEYPSWLYPITMGATTIWERWDGIKPDSTFQNKGMNSFNHYAYGAIGKWLYSTVAGIDVDEKKPGYKNIIFKPIPGGELTFASAEITTVYGKASSSWEINNDNFVHVIVIPPNTTGTVFIDPKSVNDIRINGQKIDAEHVLEMNIKNNNFVLGSGTYKIEY